MMALIPIPEISSLAFGIIGSSNYEQWATELSLIVSNQANYSILQDNVVERLEQLVDTYSTKAQISLTPKAFTF